jgi:ATP-dependent Clp protease ATP-binding subunit ClpC
MGSADKNDNSGNIKMKFCESLDRFVAVRSFTPNQKKELFRNVKVLNKQSYMRLIINACVVNYIAEIAPLLFKKDDFALLGDIVEQELYNLCVKVNPSLDIKEVTIPVSDKNNNLTFLNSGEETVGTGSGDERYLDMENELKKRIVGQDEAVRIVSQAVRKAKVGLKNPERPIGGFIFIGQTGVGKTELAKALSAYLFGTQELIRVDCSEYAMSHEYAKLIGAPPGYIGHNDGGYLTEAIKNQPQSVVVFDEIEKAHKKVHNLLLQILDEGRLTDSKGVVVSFDRAIIILTSNVGIDRLEQMAGAIGFGDNKAAKDENVKMRETKKALEKIFPPEFLNRIDEIMLFRNLTQEDNVQIIDIMLRDVEERLQNLNLSMNLSVEAKRYLVNEGTNLKYGARPLRRAIQKYIENPLAEFILNGQLEAGDTVSIDCLSVEKMLAFTKPDLVSGEEIKLLLSEEKNKAEADEKSAEAEKAVGIEETTDAGKTVKKPAGKRKSGTRGKK